MKWITRLIGFFVVLVLVAGVSIFFLPADRIAKLAANQMRVVTGRDVTITGDVSMTLFPVLGVNVGGLEVGNAEWSEQGPMLTAENAAIGVDLMAYIRNREIRITNIEATRPTIRLESRKDGRASWVFTDASGTAQIETEVAPAARTPQAISIQRLSVTDATLIYDAEGADLVSYTGVDLTLDWPERLGAADITASLSPAGNDVNVDARIGAFAGFITGQVQPVTLSVSAGGGTLSLNGRASTAGDVAGRLSLDMPSTDAFMAALALPRPGLPAGLGKAAKLQSDLTLTSDRRLSLRDLSADLGGNALTGAADITLNGKPVINAQLNAGALDLSGLSSGGDSAGGSPPAPAGSGWPKDRIDASGLAAFDGEIALTASSIDLGQFKLGKTRTLLRNDNSRMVYELREVSAYGGTVTGEFVANNRSGLSVGGKMIASGIDMQAVLTDAAGLDRLTGDANAELNFLGVGQSVDAIMKSLSGSGAIKFGQGTIIGIDLDRLMRSGQTGGGTTVFDSLGATWTMDSGVMRNQDLLLQLANYEARGAGQVGLGAQTIDYTFTPVALRANSGNSIAIPVRIYGPWSNISIRPDLEAAIDLNLGEKIEEEKARIKEQARSAARQKLAEELNVTDTGQDLEDAAKEKLKDEVRKGLFKLFD